MSISLQIVELPDNEQVTSRQVSLPEAGGTIGRSYECTLQLPDFNRTLSRIHLEISKHPESGEGSGYIITDRSRNGSYVNGTLLGHGRRKPLQDGDTIRLGGYSLLVSTLESILSPQPRQQARQGQQLPTLQPDFSMAGVEHEETDVVPKKMVHKRPAPGTAKKGFSSANALSDDAFGYDPFEQEDDAVAMKRSNRVSVVDENEEHEPVLDYEVQLRKPGLPANGTQKQLHQSVRQLNQLIEKQKQLAQQQGPSHGQILDCLQATLDRFLDNFSPEHLQEDFNDYVSGWGNRDKKYWALYRKQFVRKLKRREYHRQFSALFLEELRKKR